MQLFIRQAATRHPRISAGKNLSPAHPDIPAPADHGAQASASLWLCIAFPGLILEALGIGDEPPAVAISGEGSSALVVAANTSAEWAGITPGVSLNTALALLPVLSVHQRAMSAEAAVLQNLARWALRFTPVVSIDPDGALLLEIRGSLRLFGGLGQLRKQLKHELSGRGCRAVMASAPVPRAALWLVRAGIQFDCNNTPGLPGVLAELPLECLRWPARVQHKLMQMGVRTLGECFRLPREGFARRIGPEYLLDIDQGLGRQPELLRRHREPYIFNECFELPGETQVAGEIETAACGLFDRLADFLRERQASTERLDLHFEHYRRPASLLEIALREPSAHTSHLLELLRLKLDRQALPAPVTAIKLRAVAMPLAAFSSGSLFGRTQSEAAGRFTGLIERLRARLGDKRVHGLGWAADYRPEYAWRTRDIAGPGYTSDVPGEMASRVRPLWLLEQPRRLNVHRGRPVDDHNRLLVFSSDAERIESGWWDGNDVRRDYYTVTGHRGGRWWIFRDCRNSCWYLHGVYA
ncbi:MAG: DNA polymerase Y family protein [Gammaproteobacteria bacterium]|nr:DNA polymerase Y family protein [Gammaproteobacteria bacterium]MDP6694302.1 DNA polymerase Y family protein [Gammaproteobacteria bacterium]